MSKLRAPNVESITSAETTDPAAGPTARRNASVATIGDATISAMGRT
jgi:hypothetical protein